MFETVLSSSSNSLGKAIDEYHDPSSFSGSSDSSNSNTSSGENTMDKYVSGVPGVPLEVFQGLKTSMLREGNLRNVKGTGGILLFIGCKLWDAKRRSQPKYDTWHIPRKNNKMHQFIS